MSTFKSSKTVTAAIVGLSLLPSSAAASAPQASGANVFYHGLEHVPLGLATAQTAGDHLVVSNIGSSGDDGVRILLTEADTFMSSVPLDPAAPVGASMMSEVTGTVGGLQNAPAGRVGLERTPTGFLAVVDFSALGSPTYDVRIFADDVLVHSNTGLTANVIELQPSTPVDMQCWYFAKCNIWIWDEDDFVVISDTQSGTQVVGNRIELRPNSSVPPTEGPLEVDVLGAGMPQFLIIDEALGKFESLHRGDQGTAMHACSDCLVVSNIGSSGDDGTGLTISNIGSSGEDGVWNPSPQPMAHESEILSMDLTGYPSSLGLTATVLTTASTETSLGTLSCTAVGPGAWDLEADFTPLGTDTYAVQFLLDGSADGFLPVVPNPIRVAAAPTALSTNGQFLFMGLRPGYSARFDSPQLIAIPGAGSFVADELRFIPMDSATGPIPAIDSLLTVRIETEGIQSYTIGGESSLLADSYCTATPNSTGLPAEILANGSSSVAANDLVLLAAPVPNQFGVLFYGPNQTAVPFGNGILCVGGEIHRLDVEVASAGGDVESGVVLARWVRLRQVDEMDLSVLHQKAR
jgi:hypothetical protein